MRKTTKSPGEKIVKDIKRATRKHYSSEEKTRIVLDGLRGEDSIAELCRGDGITHGPGHKRHQQDACGDPRVSHCGAQWT
jgi:transposase